LEFYLAKTLLFCFAQASAWSQSSSLLDRLHIPELCRTYGACFCFYAFPALPRWANSYRTYGAGFTILRFLSRLTDFCFALFLQDSFAQHSRSTRESNFTAQGLKPSQF
jgi:hypothetical protein